MEWCDHAEPASWLGPRSKQSAFQGTTTRTSLFGACKVPLESSGIPRSQSEFGRLVEALLGVRRSGPFILTADKTPICELALRMFASFVPNLVREVAEAILNQLLNSSRRFRIMNHPTREDVTGTALMRRGELTAAILICHSPAITACKQQVNLPQNLPKGEHRTLSRLRFTGFRPT